MRSVPLCPECDREVLEAALAQRRPIPEGYVSRFLYGKVDEYPPVGTHAKRPTGSTAKRPGAARALSRSAMMRPASTPRVAPQLADPTVRQATEQFLLQVEQPTDSVVLVVLGSYLGPSTRLSSLGTAGAQAGVADWFDELWGKPSQRDGRERARRTLVELASYWQRRGWVPIDLAAGLHPGTADQPTS